MFIHLSRLAGIAVAFMCLSLPVFAQTAEDGGEKKEEGTLPIESNWSGLSPSLYSRGDQTFVIALGTTIPLTFYGDSGSIDSQLSVGGLGSLNYNYYLSPNFALGGEVNGMFSGTVGGNVLFMVPFGVKATWHFIKSPFEFPLSLTLGGASQSYLDGNYFGLFIKPAAAAYWRFNPDWSFGINTAWWWLPQWTNNQATTVYGNFLELTLAARYHF
ncbi:hypothetical protein MASR2M78_04070 [Treponema sp.]